MKLARLPAYLRRRVGSQVLMLLVMITALMQVLELLDVTTDILKRGLGLGGLFHYALLQTPGELVLALPLAVLLGAMMALGSMARHSEITAIRSAGVSLTQIFLHLLPLGLVFAAAQFLLSEQGMPRAETAMKAWWSATAPPDPGGPAAKDLWARTSAGPVAIGGASPDGRRLQALRIYGRDAEGLLTSRVSAARAEWDGQAWRLEDVTELRILPGGMRPSHEATREWKTNLRPDDVLRIDVSRPHLSSIMLAEVIVGARAGTQPRSYYQTVLYRSFSTPLGIFVMLLLALPVATASQRGGQGKGREVLVALGLGLGFLLCDGIVASLGTSGRFPPLAVALAAPLVFGAIGLLQLRARERA